MASTNCDTILEKIISQGNAGDDVQAHIQTCSECRQALASLAILKTLGSPAQRMQPSQKFLEDFEKNAVSADPSSRLSDTLLAKLLLTALLSGALLLGIKHLSGTGSLVEQHSVSSSEQGISNENKADRTLAPEPELIEKPVPAPVLKFDAPDKKVE